VRLYQTTHPGDVLVLFLDGTRGRREVSGALYDNPIESTGGCLVEVVGTFGESAYLVRVAPH